MNPMLKLFARNRHKGQFRAEATAAAESTIYLYDMIVDSDDEAEWFGGVSPQAFSKALRAITSPTIHLRVYSPGGSVFAARAMEQAIREHASRIVVHIDGLAASAASFLIMAADEIRIAPGAFIMVHKAWTMAYGNSDELTKTAALLDQVDGTLVQTYAKRTGQSEADITAMLAAETWLESERAVELGFADAIDDANPAPSDASTWDLTAYGSAPKNIAAAPPASPANPAPDRTAMARAAKARIAQLQPA